MLTHVHLLVHTLWCWHTLRRDSALFEKMKCIFSIALVGNLEKSRECFSLRNTHRTLTQKHRTLFLCVRWAGSLTRLGLRTERSLERPVVCVRCEEVLQTSLRMSPVSTGRSGCVRWLASGDPASLRSSLRMSPVCTGRAQCQLVQRLVLCRLPLDSDTRLTLEHRTLVLSIRCPFKSVRWPRISPSERANGSICLRGYKYMFGRLGAKPLGILDY